MKKCPKCQATINDNAKFCTKCGCNINKYYEENSESNVMYCPECGGNISKDDVFCQNCGFNLNGNDDYSLEQSNDDFLNDIAKQTEEINNQKKITESLSSFETVEHNDGTYTITGLKDKFAMQYTVPDNVVSIADHAFEGCGAIKIELSEDVVKIGNCAFKDCKDLSEINLPNSLKIIGDEAFANCELLDIVVPSSVIRVGKDALKNTIPDKKAREKARQEAERKAAEEKAKWSIGGNPTFGSYYKESSNKKEPIEWVVLKRENDKALIITKYGIDCKRYNETFISVTWETCTLRKWLNNDFYSSAFSNEEKNKILNTKIHTLDNSSYSTKGGNDTNDKVFLLSIEETENYLSSSLRMCKPTSYAKLNGAYVNGGNCWWWLRSPGRSQISAASVSRGGGIDCNGYNVYDDGECVRPALWINL